MFHRIIRSGRVNRIKNPLRYLTREQKLMFGIMGGVVLLGATLATVAWASKSAPVQPRKAIEVGDACTQFAVISDQQFGDDLRARLRSAAERGPIDPFQVASVYVRYVAPACPTYPSNTTTPGQVKLFAMVYMRLLQIMQQEDFLSSTDFPMWYGMLTTWALGQGVPVEEL